MIDPRAEYARRLEERRSAAARLDRVDARVAVGRLVIAFVAAGVAYAALRHGSSWAWSGAPAAAFVALAIVHGRVIARRRTAERAGQVYEDGLARLDDRPPERGDGGLAFLDDVHPYAADLDLFGRGSLFERLDTTRTRPGESTLAAWLCEPAAPTIARARQAAIRELRDGLDLREDLAVLGDAVRTEADTDRLRRWARETGTPGPPSLRLLAPVLAAVSLAAFVGWGVGMWGPLPFVGALLVQSAVVLPFRRRIAHVLAQASDPEHDLELLAAVIERFERERFEAPLLVGLRTRLQTSGVPPSRRVRGLARLLDLAEARRNQLFLPVSLVLLWGTQFAFALAAWRARYGAAIEHWLDATGELEALAALSGHAFEHPDDPFPELVDGSEAMLEAEALGHPLIPDRRCVRNDIRLGTATRLLVVSGSNMSGKSTLLRTVGVNVVLALAGAPVRARSLRLSSMAVGATLRIQDSLQAGESRFYAEISRMRSILGRADETAAGGVPVLFLLDEILAGTNSHDRAIGAEAILRGLLDRGAVGLVTTHDLALAELAERLAPAADNVHFEDRLVDGRMVFDYRMRPGVVRRSNALELMRSIGLDV